MQAQVLDGDCLEMLELLEKQSYRFALTFLDPPFNQGKDYAYTDDVCVTCAPEDRMDFPEPNHLG
jgi:16S rRNA G966 N2-methylase RsmD